MQPTQGARPTGITILAVLAAIGGVLGLVAGAALMGFGGLAAGSGFLTGSILTIFGLVAIAQSVALLAFAYGAWTLQPWGWILGVASIVVGLIINALFILNGSEIGSQIVSIALSAAILYYLFTPAVKQAFGRA